MSKSMDFECQHRFIGVGLRLLLVLFGTPSNSIYDRRVAGCKSCQVVLSTVIGSKEVSRYWSKLKYGGIKE